MTTARSARRLRLLLLAVLGAAMAAALVGCSDREPVGKRVIVLGFDGMDWAFVQRMLGEIKLVALSELDVEYHSQPLGTSLPPQSPVAWSDFITGMDAGGHGIFDFIHRDPETMVPYLSTSATHPPGRTVRIGGWQIPLGRAEVRLLRRGTPFWEVLEAHGVPTTIVRIPANFPPSGTASRELSGMGTPDLLGGYGTFTFFTSVPERITREVTGGRVVKAEVVDHVFRGALAGPPNPFRTDGDSLRIPLVAYRDPVRPVAKIVVDDQEVLLAEGEWTSWVPLTFDALPPLARLRGMVRLYLKAVHPEFELYVSPINLDPLHPAMPISHPPAFAAELARATGRYYTQGMPEDTKALTSGVLNEMDFLRQAGLAAREQRRQYEYLLDGFEDGLLFYYFGFLDQASHVMWHPMDPGHPAHDPERDAPYARTLEGLYEQADEIIEHTLKKIGYGAALYVMSDHGFTSWRRAFHLNAWLRENGYLALRDPERQGEVPFLQNVDWSRTRAYALGFSGVYLNLRGRERFGIVPPAQARLLREEIAGGLRRLVDPATGEPAVAEVYIRDEAFSDGGARHVGPDLVIGYAKGVRASDDTGEGRVPRELWDDNTEKWSGDHIMDPSVVPGVLFSNRPLKKPVTSLRDLAAAIMAEFGVEEFPAAPEPGRQPAGSPE